MYQSRLLDIELAPRHGSVDPIALAAFLDAWETAKTAYSDVLRIGVHRPDNELARDESYRKLLQAGLRIYRLGGSGAVGVVSEYLGRFDDQESAGHFKRLWCGLLPEKAH